MKLLKWIVAAVVISAGVLAIHARAVLPCRCSTVERRVEVSTLRIADPSVDPYIVVTSARENLAAIDQCLKNTPRVNLLMVAAANLRFLGRHNEAIRIYEKALTVDRRPELYFNLGMTQIDAGLHKDGIRNIVYACIFDPNLRLEVGLYRDEVEREVNAYQIYMQRLKQSI